MGSVMWVRGSFWQIRVQLLVPINYKAELP
jgi:hypothetical protein